jgi:hypothetical protein
MLGVFAEFETNLRRERQLEGIARAKRPQQGRAFMHRERVADEQLASLGDEIERVHYYSGQKTDKFNTSPPSKTLLKTTYNYCEGETENRAKLHENFESR